MEQWIRKVVESEDTRDGVLSCFARVTYFIAPAAAAATTTHNPQFHHHAKLGLSGCLKGGRAEGGGGREGEGGGRGKAVDCFVKCALFVVCCVVGWTERASCTNRGNPHHDVSLESYFAGSLPPPGLQWGKKKGALETGPSLFLFVLPNFLARFFFFFEISLILTPPNKPVPGRINQSWQSWQSWQNWLKRREEIQKSCVENECKENDFPVAVTVTVVCARSFGGWLLSRRRG